MTDRALSPADAALAEALGAIAAELRVKWADDIDELRAQSRRELTAIRNEAALAIAEMKNAMLELLLSKSMAPAEAVDRLRALPGGRQ